MSSNALIRPQCKVMILFDDAYFTFAAPTVAQVERVAFQWLENMEITEYTKRGTVISQVWTVEEKL